MVFQPPKEQLQEFYVNQSISIDQLSTLYGVAQSSIRKALKAYGLLKPACVTFCGERPLRSRKGMKAAPRSGSHVHFFAHVEE